MSLYLGDVRDGLRQFIAAGVRAQTCVTSPPYYGLRDYGTAQWAGGDEGCDHAFRGTDRGTREELPNPPAGWAQRAQGAAHRDCYCGATRIDRQLGLEPTIAEYVANMVAVFRLVREVLADDGTLWLNLGDSYAGSWGAQSRTQYRPAVPGDELGWGLTFESFCDLHPNGVPMDGISKGQIAAHPRGQQQTGTIRDAGLKPKDLCGIPWRVAFALQADGWWLRQDIIWAKPNPMPESVTDRCTKSHEYLFLLSKQATYYYDADAIREKNGSEIGWDEYNATKVSGRGGNLTANGVMTTHKEKAVAFTHPDGRNRRSVWTVTTQPYAEAHFATFPVALVEPCIMAGSRPGDTVLDPFMGSGTVAQVAQDLGRRWLGCELNPDYAKLIHRRTAQQALALAAD